MTEKWCYLSAENESSVCFFLQGNDYVYAEGTAPNKKVILTNPEVLKEATIMSFISAFKGTGHVEWEVLMGAWLLEAAGKAIAEGGECDITRVFNTDFSIPNDRKSFTKEQVYEHIIDFFTIEEETEDMLKLSLNVG